MVYALSAVSQYIAVTSTSTAFTNPMVVGQAYRLTANTDCWVKVTTTGGAAQASTANNILLISGQTIILTGPYYDPSAPSTTTTTNAFVHVIRNSADGKATLTTLIAVPG